MQLQKIERIGRKIPQAIFDPRCEVLAVVTFDSLLRQRPASLCRNDDLVLPLLFELRNQAFAAPVAVDVGGVNEVNATINGAVEGGERLLIGDIAPESANGPRAEANF